MDHPNILLIMCDQLSIQHLGCYDGDVPTRNLERIAKKGVVFTNAVCTTPSCSPSRASLVTGLYPHTHGINYNVNRFEYPAIYNDPDYKLVPCPDTEEGLKKEDLTIEKILHKSGYQTLHSGKWHLLEEDLPYYPKMFRENGKYLEEMKGFFQKTTQKPRKSWMKWYNWNLPVTVSKNITHSFSNLNDTWKSNVYAEFVRKIGHLDIPIEKTFDYQVMQKTITDIQKYSKSKNPFMITCSFNSPHDPNTLPSPYYEMISPAKIKLPNNTRHKDHRFSKDFSSKIVADLDENFLREFLRIYYGSIIMIDDFVGKILTTLDNSGVADRTIIIFTADHGDMTGGHSMIWKCTSSLYDEILKIPLILSYPKEIKGGQKLASPVSITDIMPTILELCEEAIPTQVQGSSLAPCLLNNCAEELAPAYAYSERLEFQAMHKRIVESDMLADFSIRNKKWKYILYKDGTEYLHNIDEDKEELTNLAENTKYKSVLTEMRKHLKEWLLKTNGTVSLQIP